jgi:hypothetical protein
MIPDAFMPTPDQLLALSSSATETLAPAWAWASDFLILIIPILFLVGFARVMGNGPYVSLIASLYIGYALYSVFPFFEQLPVDPPLVKFGAEVAVYVGFWIMGYLLLRRVAVSDFIHIGTIGLTLISFATAGFFFALLYHTFPTQTVYTFSPAVDFLFAQKEFFVAWFAAPLLGLFFFTR